MKIGDEVFVHGYVDEIRKDVVIIKNEGGYFGTDPSEIKRNETRGAYQCFNCGQKSVAWDNDFSFEDCGYMGDGIVHMCHCNNCGAVIEYRIRLDEEDEPQMDCSWK